MPRNKQSLAKRAATLVLALCMVFTTAAQSLGAVAYADSTSTAINSSMSVDPGAPESAPESESTSVDTETDDSASVPPAESNADSSSETDASSLPPESESNSDSDSSSSSQDADSSTSSSEPVDSSSQPENGDESAANSEPESGSSSSSDVTSEDESDATVDEDADAEEFVGLVVLDPENGDVVEAELGDEVTFNFGLNRDDVEVSYQWQKFIEPKPVTETAIEPLYEYTEGVDTGYNYPIEGTTEAETLAANPNATWAGIETYFAVVDALDAIGADSSNVSLEWNTRNFALDGYTIAAADVNGTIELYAEKDGERYVGTLNEEGKWAFGDAIAAPEQLDAVPEGEWLDIEGANDPSYTFTVAEDDYRTTYRLKVIITDEEYLVQCQEILAEQGVELTEEQKAAEQAIYSVAMSVHSGTWEADQVDGAAMAKLNLNAVADTLASVGAPKLSSDAQWIEGLNSNYEYITKDTYDRVSQWLSEGKITQKQADRYWSRLLTGWKQATYANVLDENGFPVGGEDNTRLYNGYNLTDGKLEIASEWYGKTVYFRPHGTSGTGTAIDIPAYTSVSVDGDGNYVEAAAGTKYKTAITFLNAYVKDAKPMYEAFLNFISTDGWFRERNENGQFTSTLTNMHIETYVVDAESFNSDPQRYLVDAEGNYRMDSVGWGVCVASEPDISGKAYWVLKDYIANGYGFLTGHDTMYAYAGAYYDAFGTDLDESTIDPNDGTTWYYDINSWMPGTTATDPNGNKSATRGGHFYVNELMGSNAGNVDSGTTVPSDAPSLILSAGGSHGKYGKDIQFGTKELHIVQNGYTAEQAQQDPKYRTPTNYPYAFAEGYIFPSSHTHTNSQVAFGPIWVNYHGDNLGYEMYGYEKDPRTWSVDGMTGTNNFYLSGNGNFLMNQIGHLPTNAATAGEAALFGNTIAYVSQRKQCEICAANQNDQQTVHYVKRINSANADEVLSALQAGGTYWYPIDGCYMLTDDITLPEDWTPIKGFKGHWNSDVYEVNLNSKGTPLLANDEAEGHDGWNLGTDQTKGVEYVFNNSNDMVRTTGVARVLGDLNDLFGTNDKNYAGYTVKILGSDNPRYMSANEKYTCTVNTDSKYVISNLPCIYDSATKSGILNVRVYDASGREVTEYGSIKVNVAKEFWDNDETIPLYLGSFAAEPLNNDATYEAAQAQFYANASSSEDFDLARWEYKKPGETTWNTLNASDDIVIDTQKLVPGQPGSESDLYHISSTLHLNNTDPAWNDYQYRAVFTSDTHGEWNTYEYYWQGSKASNEPFDGAQLKTVWTPNNEGKLSVSLWPAYAEQDANKTVNEGGVTQFRAFGYALADGTKISAEWEYALPSTENVGGEAIYNFQPVAGTNEFGGIEEVTTKTVSATSELKNAIEFGIHALASDNDLDLLWENAGFEAVESTLTINKPDVAQDGYRFRVHFTATSEFGTQYDWYSDIANEWNGSWNTQDGAFGNFSRSKKSEWSSQMNVIPPDLDLITAKSADFAQGAVNQDLMTPDEYGQTLLLKNINSVTTEGTAAYRATIYYRPDTAVPTPTWQYMTYGDRTPKTWNQDVARSLGYSSIRVWFENSDPVPTTYNGESGWMVITSTMYIADAPIAMYNPESWLKYFFRCVGTTTVETVRRTKEFAATDKWGGLSMDYAIALQHNGVLGYGGVNKINNQTVNDAAGIQSATQGKGYSDWYFPNIKAKVPAGHHINTVIISLDKTGRDSRDTITINQDAINYNGIYVPQKSSDFVVLTSATMNSVELSTWNNVLANYVGFRTYDKADYSAESVANGTTGGLPIKWIVDEARLDGSTFDPSTGHMYKVIDFGGPVDWNTAKAKAQEYNSEYMMSGQLAKVETSAENTVIHNLVGNRNAWLGGQNVGGTWKWTDGSNISWIPWIGGAQTGNSYMYITGNGGWNSGPVNTSYWENRNWKSGWSSQPDGRIQKSGLKTSTIMFDIPGAGNTNVTKITGATVNFEYNVYDGNAMSSGDVFFGANQTEGGMNGDGVTWIGYGTGKVTSAGWHSASIRYYPSSDATGIYGWIWNNAGYKWASANVRINVSVDYQTLVQTSNNPVTCAVVEYVPQSLGIAVTDHSATDNTVIGTNATVTPPQGEKVVSAIIKGNTKVYDGKPIAPESFEVSGSDGASRDLFNITYTTRGEFADYSDHTVSGGNYTDTGAKNAAVYHATVTLTDAAKQAGWSLNERYSQLECDLIITQRPVNVYSHNNDKTYDGTGAGIIRNIQKEALAENSGVISGDTVNLNTTSVTGSYVKDGAVTIHNSKTNNGGNEYEMHRNGQLSKLYIVHDDVSDPHHNYVLGTETYSGDINQRPVDVHSIYLEDPDFPRNVKTYDGTTKATIRDILIDNVVGGDEIGLKEPVMTGTYTTHEAGETLTEDGKVQPDRDKKLVENAITADKGAELTGNDFNDYYINSERYTGAIRRAGLELVVKNKSEMYGSEKVLGQPTFDADYGATTTSESWLNIVGLLGNDTIHLDKSFFDLNAHDSADKVIVFSKTTPVGTYPVEARGLNETNNPVLKNYIVAQTGGAVDIYEREIVVTPNDIDVYELDPTTPMPSVSFEMLNDDEETYTKVGSDDAQNYSDMPLIESDTVANTIFLNDGTETLIALAKGGEAVVNDAGEDSELEYRTLFSNGSNIDYATRWYPGAAPIYVGLNGGETLETYPCEWCEKYHGTKEGTDHWHIDGYALRVNQNPEQGKVMEVKTVKNLLDEDVQNYKLVFQDAQLRVHPKIRFQLEATVPMYVCMYGYAGDGEVVEPTTYGITNYSNGALEVKDIDVSADGWNIVDKARNDLLRGEISMQLNGTQLVMGNNTPAGRENWIIAPDESEDKSGVERILPLECFIAGGNVNERSEVYLTRVTYTVGEYGITLPYVEGVEYPEFVNGEPVFVSGAPKA